MRRETKGVLEWVGGGEKMENEEEEIIGDEKDEWEEKEIRESREKRRESREEEGEGKGEGEGRRKGVIGKERRGESQDD